MTLKGKIPLNGSFYVPYLPQKIKQKGGECININKLETTDIFRGAYFLCMGGSLCDVRFRNNGKRIASFMFTGTDLGQLDRDYMNGNALVNPIQFRESLNRLRDILFEKQRKQRGDRYGSGKNRAHQNYR